MTLGAAVYPKRDGSFFQEGQREIIAGNEAFFQAGGTRRGWGMRHLVEPCRHNGTHAASHLEGPVRITLDLQSGPQKAAVYHSLRVGERRE